MCLGIDCSQPHIVLFKTSFAINTSHLTLEER